MNIEITPTNLTIGVLLFGALQFLAALWISERFKAALQRENNAFLEKIRWDFKVKEQAARVASYMSLARSLPKEADAKEYEKANALAWEIAMWLPEDVYRSLVKALKRPDAQTNPLSVVVQVRKMLLGDNAGDLTSDDILHHAPGIGEKKAG